MGTTPQGFALRRPRAGLVLAASLLVAACGGPEEVPVDAAAARLGQVDAGQALLSVYGCGNCHTIPGVTGATGTIGPPLTRFARRAFIAGRLPNHSSNLVTWIRDPQGVEPGTAMPDLMVAEQEAWHMSAYLYTLR